MAYEPLHFISNDDILSYEQLIALYQQYSHTQGEEILVMLEAWFDANLSAVLGGILEKLSQKHKIKISATSEKIIDILSRNAFLPTYTSTQIKQDLYHTAIPYLRLDIRKSQDFHHYLQEQLFAHQKLPTMQPKLKQKIQESIFEIFTNAITHSQSQSIHICGQYFPQKQDLAFCITDTGIGFARSIQNKFKQTLDSTQAIKWVIQEGNTTKNVTGGLGLSIIQDFITINQGQLYIISGNAILCIKNGRKEYKILENFFDGVIVNMVFKTDDNKRYGLKSDFEDLDDLF